MAEQPEKEPATADNREIKHIEERVKKLEEQDLHARLCVAEAANAALKKDLDAITQRAFDISDTKTNLFRWGLGIAIGIIIGLISFFAGANV